MVLGLYPVYPSRGSNLDQTKRGVLKGKKRGPNGWICNTVDLANKWGVSIVGFEDQCYSLLRRIDEERKRKIKDAGPRQQSVSGKKCL